MDAATTLSANFCLGHAGDTVNNATSLYEILDKDPGHHLVSYLSSLHPLSALRTLRRCAPSVAFLFRFCRREPESNFTRGLALMHSHAQLISGAPAETAPLSTFGESVSLLRVGALSTSEFYFIVDYDEAQNYTPVPIDPPAYVVFKQDGERDLVHEAAWEALRAADRSPYEEREAADLLRYNQELAESIFYNALLASDPSTTSATRNLLLALTRAIGHHDLTWKYRCVEDSFIIIEASSLLSLQRDLEGGERASDGVRHNAHPHPLH